jgi:predicted acylesterase/phospholipase RssA
VPKPIPIQLAIQGGGAKLPAILAALEAVAELEESGELFVTRIAATSAGSIAGCLFAAPVAMSVVRTHLKAKADKFADQYRMPGVLLKAKQVVSGGPFWDVSLLKRSLVELFGQRTMLGQLKKDVIIVATDLKNLKKVVRASKTDPLIDSILDSCAIPLFFRTFTNEKDGAALIVDGGICANLPSEELTAGPDGEVVGISFATTIVPGNPTGVIGFSQALLNTAMEHAVLRARQQLGDRLLTIETDIDTFDFSRAMTEGLGKEWDNCYRQAKAFFQTLVSAAVEEERRRQEAAEAEARFAADEAERAQRKALRVQELTAALNDMRAKVVHIFDRQEAPKLLVHERFSLVVAGYSLADGSQPDVLIRKMRFQAANEPIYAYKGSSTTPANEQPVSDDFRIYDKDSNELSFQRIELEPWQKVLDGAQAIVYPMIMYFDTPLLPGDVRGPFDLVTYERYTSVLGKLRAEDDKLSSTVIRRATPVPIVDIVLHLPKSYMGTVLSGGGLYDEAGKWDEFHSGTAIAPNALNREYPPPDGFFAVGWRGLNLPLGKRFGCIINRYKGVAP